MLQLQERVLDALLAVAIKIEEDVEEEGKGTGKAGGNESVQMHPMT